MKYTFVTFLILVLRSCDNTTKEKNTETMTGIDTCEMTDDELELLKMANAGAEYFVKRLKQEPPTMFILNRPLISYVSADKRAIFCADLHAFINDSTVCGNIDHCLMFNSMRPSQVCLEVTKILADASGEMSSSTVGYK